MCTELYSLQTNLNIYFLWKNLHSKYRKCFHKIEANDIHSFSSVQHDLIFKCNHWSPEWAKACMSESVGTADQLLVTSDCSGSVSAVWDPRKMMTLGLCILPVPPLLISRGTVFSVQFSRSVMSNCLWLHGLQYTKLPCSSPTPRACSNSCPSSQWCHPTISSSVIPFSSCLQSFPASGSFPMSPFFTSVAKVLEFQLQHQSFQWIFRTDFLSDWLVWSPCSPRDSQESSPTPQFKSISSLALPYSSNGKESACDAGDQGSIPGSGRSSGERKYNPLQYSCLENSMEREAWWATVHGVTKSQTWLSD